MFADFAYFKHTYLVCSILRIFGLNSDEDDTISDVLCLYHNLTKCGHKEETLMPLFLKAIANARKFTYAEE